MSYTVTVYLNHDCPECVLSQDRCKHNAQTEIVGKYQDREELEEIAQREIAERLEDYAQRARQQLPKLLRDAFVLDDDVLLEIARGESYSFAIPEIPGADDIGEETVVGLADAVERFGADRVRAVIAANYGDLNVDFDDPPVDPDDEDADAEESEVE